ncbi:hypothetical protein ABZ599_32125 [Streptomyces misionensis]|uniref:hypothetical protein n=1 Tax=Streptomyces misionensis TaxID=67331 RepID=UPI0033F50504
MPLLKAHLSMGEAVSFLHRGAADPLPASAGVGLNVMQRSPVGDDGVGVAANVEPAHQYVFVQGHQEAADH